VPVPTVAGFPSCNLAGKPRDTSDVTASTNSFQNIQCYDLEKVQKCDYLLRICGPVPGWILLNEIDGKKSDGTVLNPPLVPAIFGMNFQA